MILVTVIIPFYSEIDLIARAVDSVIANSDVRYDLEVVIGNDGNIPCETIYNRLSESAKNIVKIVINHNNHGPGGARNAALEASTGELIAFLDADDYWLPSKLSLQLEQIQKGYSFVTTGYSLNATNLSILPPIIIRKPLDIFIDLGIGTSTVLLTRSLLDRSKFRDLRFAQDIDFWYNLAQSQNFNYKAISIPLAVYSTNGSSKNKFEQLRYFIRVLSLNNISFFLQLKILGNYILRGILNHYIKVNFLKIRVDK